MPIPPWSMRGLVFLVYPTGTRGTSMSRHNETNMPKFPTRQLRLDRQAFDLEVLTAQQRSTENTQRTAISQYVREQIARLGGVIETLAVDNREIRLAWRPEAVAETAVDRIVDILKKGELSPAVLLLRLLLSDNPADPILLYNLGMALSDQNRLAEAMTFLEQLLQREPNHANGRVALGVAQMRAGNTDLAVQTLELALTLDPQNPWAHRNLAAGLLKLKRSEEGLQHIRQAVELNPKDELAWYGLGQALEVAGDAAGADDAYLKVIELDEYSRVAEPARQARSRLAQKTFRTRVPAGVERPDAVMYCLSALQKFTKLPPNEVQNIGFEIAILGVSGLEVNNPDRKYTLRTLPGEFTGLQLMSYMYVAFKQIAPQQDISFDLSREYAQALQLFQPNG
jgi:tetratricopeptide (TPR) repeat protein